MSSIFFKADMTLLLFLFQVMYVGWLWSRTFHININKCIYIHIYMYIYVFIYFHGSTAPSGPGPALCPLLTITFFGHTTLGRTPLEEWSARRRDLNLTTLNTHKRQTSMPPGGFEPPIPADKRQLQRKFRILRRIIWREYVILLSSPLTFPHPNLTSTVMHIRPAVHNVFRFWCRLNSAGGFLFRHLLRH